MEINLSIQALAWVLDETPDLPPNLFGVLCGLANHADADGRGAYPSVDRLAFYSRKSRRQVQTDLAKLRELRLITEGDQRLVAHIDPRYRPIVYDLALDRRRPRYVKSTTAPEQEPTAPGKPRDEVEHDQGCGAASPGVKPASPKPSFEPSFNPSPTSRPSAAQPPIMGEEDRSQDPITTATDEALRHRPDWKRATVIAAIRQAVSDGLPEPVACKVMPELALGEKYGPTTAGPQRLIARGPWWTPGEVFVPQTDDKTRCPRHPQFPADSCRCCRADEFGADDEEQRRAIPARTAPPQTARELLARFGFRTRDVQSDAAEVGTTA
jgi:hypothetical protein